MDGTKAKHKKARLMFNGIVIVFNVYRPKAFDAPHK